MQKCYSLITFKKHFSPRYTVTVRYAKTSLISQSSTTQNSHEKVTCIVELILSVIIVTVMKN